MEPFNPVKKGDPPREIPEVPMNIKTNPVKKGSYGANGASGKWKSMLSTPPAYSKSPPASCAASAPSSMHPGGGACACVLSSAPLFLCPVSRGEDGRAGW